MVQEVTALREGPDGGIGVSRILIEYREVVGVSRILIECPREVGNACLFTYLMTIIMYNTSLN